MEPHMKRAFLLLIPVLLLSLIFSACSGTEPTTPGQTTTITTTITTTPSSTNNPTTTLTATIPAAGVLNLYGTDPYSLDPAVASDANSHQYVGLIFNGLVQLDDKLQPAADIASGWKISDDRMTYTFTLRKDVTFQDGKKVTAADFKYSWERACDPATGSGIAATYLGDIVGAMDMINGKATSISGIKVVNDYTLQVTIDAPKSYFLSKLTYSSANVVDKANVAQGANWWQHPNGTGPFKLKEWQAGTLLTLERYDKFYGHKAGVQEVQFHMYAGIPMNMYETGQIDIAPVYTDYIDRITDPEGEFAAQLQSSPELSFSWIGFNVNKAPFDDPNIRKAFTLAIDKDKIIALSLRDMVKKAEGILPPGMPGYNENVKGLDYNVTEAKALIAASKYGSAANLPPIVFTTSGYGAAIPDYLQAIITEWRENLGVEVTVRQLDPERYIYNLKEEKDNLFDTGWIADYPHPQDFLDVLFHSGADNNYGEYTNSAVDALLDKAAIEPDTNKSLQYYQQAEQMLVDDAAVIPLWFGENYTLVKPNIQGYELNAMGFAWLNYVTIK
jgi:oligopeptide transport system substrate-binding protein